MTRVGRTHVVLVPGFAGFDALGQIEYYAGTTCIFREWLERLPESAAGKQAALHYFDNLPSGSVVTRAARLHAFLAKRIARHEFQPGDRLVLVGHSTGGLDIRQLIRDLQKPDERTGSGKTGMALDGPRHDAYHVENKTVLDMIQGVVFVSTPHAGTNIADFAGRWYARALTPLLLALAEQLLGLSRSRLFPPKIYQRLFGSKLLDVDAVLAAADALLEADEDASPSAKGSADAREAFAQLALWLRHMRSDFNVIQDLTTNRPPVFKEEWPAHIRTRSYATVAYAPSGPKGYAPSRLPAFLRVHHWLPGTQVKTDLVYRFFHIVVAHGRFRGGRRDEKWFQNERPENAPHIDDAASDGVVNTASMFWEHGGDTELVFADHGDIIGHYKRLPVPDASHASSGRRFHAYDFFKSGSAFDEQRFKAVWHDIFDFCIGQAAAVPLSAEAVAAED